MQKLVSVGLAVTPWMSNGIWKAATELIPVNSNCSDTLFLACLIFDMHQFLLNLLIWGKIVSCSTQPRMEVKLPKASLSHLCCLLASLVCIRGEMKAYGAIATSFRWVERGPRMVRVLTLPCASCHGRNLLLVFASCKLTERRLRVYSLITVCKYLYASL